MLLRILAALAFACALSSHARADYTQATIGMDRTVPTATPVCIMSGATCKIQLGTANLSSGEWVVSNITPTLGITRSQIATTTIPTSYQTFTVSGYAATFDGGEGCEWSRATVSAPGAVQSADGAYWALSRTSAIDVKCTGGLNNNADSYSAILNAATIAKDPTTGAYGTLKLSGKYPYYQLTTPNLSLNNAQALNGCDAGTANIQSSITASTDYALRLKGSQTRLECVDLWATDSANLSTGLRLGDPADLPGEAGTTQRVIRDSRISGFSQGVKSYPGNDWVMWNTWIDNYKYYGISIDNEPCDGGNYAMVATTIGGESVGAPAGTKGVSFECSGGSRFVGSKIIGPDYGWFNSPRDNTTDLQFVGNSIEMNSIANMWFQFAVAGKFVNAVTIVGNELGGPGQEGLVLANDGFRGGTLVGNAILGHTVSSVRIEPGASHFVAGLNQYDPSAPAIVDNRTDVLDKWGYLDRRYTIPVLFSSSVTWTRALTLFVNSNTGGAVAKLTFAGNIIGSAYSVVRNIEFSIRKTNAPNLVVTMNSDITDTDGGGFDFSIDTTSNPGAAYVNVKLSSGVGTAAYMTMTHDFSGEIVNYNYQ